jgi:hypothetical protein
MLRRHLILFGVSLAVVGGASAAPAVAGAPAGQAGRLLAGQSWTSIDGPLQSPSRRFNLSAFADSLQLTENVSAGGKAVGAACWERLIPGRNPNAATRLSMQTDGNLVLYSGQHHPLWSTRTAGTGTHNYFQVQDDGNLVVHTATGHVLWAAGEQGCLMVAGGRIAPGHALTALGALTHFVSLKMQTDGNLVLRYGSRVDWASNTHSAGATLALLTNGSLIIQSKTKKTIWSSGTAGRGAHSYLLVYDYGRAAAAQLEDDRDRIDWTRNG